MPTYAWTSSRRRFLAGLTVAPVGFASQGAQAASSLQTVASSEDPVCVLTPQSIEGPFYVDPKLIRSDITEGRDGVPLRLRLQVIEAGPCTPLAGARIDIWHCDARGLYSGYPEQGDDRSIDTSGQTFLRGTQPTDAGGWATFDTVYPGWYTGRATHIHFKAFLDDRNVLMGQIYFPDALNEFLYTNVPAYTGRTAERLVVNANDGIVKEEKDRYLASLTLGIDRNANVRGRERNWTAEGRPEHPKLGFPPPPGSHLHTGFGSTSDGPADGMRPPPSFAGIPRMSMKARLTALIPGFGSNRSK